MCQNSIQQIIKLFTHLFSPSFQTIYLITGLCYSEIGHFFQVYKDLEGKKVEILGWGSAKEAKNVITDSIKRYEDTLKKE